METLKNESVKEALKKCNPQRAIIALAEITDQFDTGIQNAQATADQALQDAAAAAAVANEAKQEAAQATINVGEAFDNTRVTPNSSTVVVEFDRINGNEQNVALPVVNTTNAGILNANDYKFFKEYDARIRAVEGVSKIYLVELPSDNPSSQQITLAYTSQWPDAPNPPLEGTVVVDPEKNNLSYRWNTQSNTWYKISEVAIQQFTNATLGTIKGSTQDGEVQANADGTGSVTGWDIVKGNITTLQENAIANTRAVASPTGVNLELINQNNVVKNTTTIPLSDRTNAGLMSPDAYEKLSAIAAISCRTYVVNYSNISAQQIGPFACSVLQSGGQSRLKLSVNTAGRFVERGIYNIGGSTSATADQADLKENDSVELTVYQGYWTHNVKLITNDTTYIVDFVGNNTYNSGVNTGTYTATLTEYSGTIINTINN